MKLTRMADSCPPLHVQRAAMMISETIPDDHHADARLHKELCRGPLRPMQPTLATWAWPFQATYPQHWHLPPQLLWRGLAKLLEHGISPEEYNVRALASIPDVNNVCCATRQ